MVGSRLLTTRRLFWLFCIAASLTLLWACLFLSSRGLTTLTCPSSIKELELLESQHIECAQDKRHHLWFRINRSDAKDPGIRIAAAAFPDGVQVDAFSDNESDVLSKVGSEENFVRTKRFSGYPQENRIISRGEFSPEDLRRGVYIKATHESGSNIAFRLLPKMVKDNAEHPYLYRSAELGDSFIWLYTLLSLLGLTVGCAMLLYARTKKAWWGIVCLCGIFWFGFMQSERPFCGMAGFMDAGDDTYYVAWTQLLLTKGHLRDCKTPQHVTFSNRTVTCFGLPGTAVMLLPLGIIGMPMLGESIRGTVGINLVRFMRLNSALYGLLAMILIFLTLHTYRPQPINIALAACILMGTSLTKWAYDRSIFTHTSEIFLWSAILAQVFALHRSKRLGWLYTIGLSFCFFLLLFVRGEFALAAPILIWLAWKTGLSKGKLAFFALSTIASLLYYKSMNQIWSVYGSGQGALIVTSLADFVRPDIQARLKDSLVAILQDIWNFGPIYFIGFSAVCYLSGKSSPHKSLWPPLLMFSIIYFITTWLFHTPLGFEWGHRYHLKHYSFFLIAIGLLYPQLNRYGRAIVWLAVAYQLIKVTNFRYFELNRNYSKTTITHFASDTFLWSHKFEVGHFSGYLFGLCIFAVIAFATMALYGRRISSSPESGGSRAND